MYVTIGLTVVDMWQIDGSWQIDVLDGKLSLAPEGWIPHPFLVGAKKTKLGLGIGVGDI